MATARLTLQRLMMDATIDMSLTITARMFGLPRQTVITIVRVGFPRMAEMAARNPELCKRMFAATLVTMPEPIEDFYVRMAESRAVRQATMDDYKATYGSMFDAANREAARQAGTTDGQAREVLAAALPALSQVLHEANSGRSKQSFVDLLKDLHVNGGRP